VFFDLEMLDLMGIGWYAATMIAGIDEVGRGAWAGPLCVAAVALGDADIAGLTDSKLLSAKKRAAYALAIKQQAAGVGIGWVSARLIDQHGLSWALSRAASDAMAQIDCPAIDHIVIDGTIRLIDDLRVSTLKKADLLVPSVSAASIVAKVARDTYMARLDDRLPGYGFTAHVGYGTAAHSRALQRIGASPVHRMSFAPLKEMTIRIADDAIAPTGIGATAEDVAAQYLVRQGYRIVERNWKTARCEIDIIAERRNVTYFVEVKYRSSGREGTGLSYGAMPKGIPARASWRR
jgi:ribonuclease HII